MCKKIKRWREFFSFGYFHVALKRATGIKVIDLKTTLVEGNEVNLEIVIKNHKRVKDKTVSNVIFESTYTMNIDSIKADVVYLQGVIFAKLKLPNTIPSSIKKVIEEQEYVYDNPVVYHTNFGKNYYHFYKEICSKPTKYNNHLSYITLKSKEYLDSHAEL